MLRRWYPIAIAASVVAAAFLTSSPATRQAAAAAAPEEKPAAARTPLFFNLTSGKDSVHAISMALGFANTAAKEGHEVTVFLNVAAPYFATKDLSEDVKVADLPPVKKLLADVIANGGKVLVCRHCAHVVKLGADSLVEGAVIAEQTDVLARIKPGTVALSY
jgi:predicted peroxiredoxin